jgi:hypothetical protein
MTSQTRIVTISISLLAVVLVIVLLHEKGAALFDAKGDDSSSSLTHPSPGRQAIEDENNDPSAADDQVEVMNDHQNSNISQEASILYASGKPLEQDDRGEESEEITEAEPPADTDNQPYIGVATHRTRVPAGGALLMGGWAMPNGDRAFILTMPSTFDDAGVAQVELNSKLFSVAPDKLSDPEWKQLAASYDAGVNNAGTVYSAESLKDLRAKLLQSVSSVFSSPRVITAAGQYASLSMGNDKQGTLIAVTASPIDGEIDLGVSVADYKGIDLTSQK